MLILNSFLTVLLCNYDYDYIIVLTVWRRNYRLYLNGHFLLLWENPKTSQGTRSWALRRWDPKAVTLALVPTFPISLQASLPLHNHLQSFQGDTKDTTWNIPILANVQSYPRQMATSHAFLLTMKKNFIQRSSPLISTVASNF